MMPKKQRRIRLDEEVDIRLQRGIDLNHHNTQELFRGLGLLMAYNDHLKEVLVWELKLKNEI